MNWKISIGEYAGIKVYIHATFVLLMLWVGISQWILGNGVSSAVSGIVYLSAIFFCVVLHEFGHALAARKFGIKTRDIILLPIGGVARLERMPRKPLQELCVALAGPAVNLVIAGILYILLKASGTFIPLAKITVFSGPFVERLMAVNIVLMLFNLLPAFPMDGGRILRAGLAMKVSYVQATRRAAQLGRGFSILFGIAGFMIGNPMLLLIAFFIWIGAGQEARLATMHPSMRGESPGSVEHGRHIAHRQQAGSNENCEFGNCLPK